MLFLSLLVWVSKRTLSMHCCELLRSLALCMLPDSVVPALRHTAAHVTFSCERGCCWCIGFFAACLSQLLFVSFLFLFFTFIHFFSPLSPTTFCFLLSLKVVRRYRVAHEVYLIAVSISFDLIALSALLSPVWFSLHASPTPLIF